MQNQLIITFLFANNFKLLLFLVFIPPFWLQTNALQAWFHRSITIRTFTTVCQSKTVNAIIATFLGFVFLCNIPTYLISVQSIDLETMYAKFFKLILISHGIFVLKNWSTWLTTFKLWSSFEERLNPLWVLISFLTPFDLYCFSRWTLFSRSLF